MLLDLIINVLVRMFVILHKWLEQTVIPSFFNFLKTFEYAVILCCAIAFLFVALFIMLRQARRLPKSYTIEAVDIYGQNATPEGLRLVFATYDVAESYARFYHDIYGEQYKFRVVGLKDGA